MRFKLGRMDGQYMDIPDHEVGPDFSVRFPPTKEGEREEIYEYFTSLDGVSGPCLLVNPDMRADAEHRGAK